MYDTFQYFLFNLIIALFVFLPCIFFKILEKSLRILFETKDVSQVKDYVNRHLMKLMTGRLSLQELTFAKEFRGIHGYKPGACVPALKLAR